MLIAIFVSRRNYSLPRTKMHMELECILEPTRGFHLGRHKRATYRLCSSESPFSLCAILSPWESPKPPIKEPKLPQSSVGRRLFRWPPSLQIELLDRRLINVVCLLPTFFSLIVLMYSNLTQLLLWHWFVWWKSCVSKCMNSHPLWPTRSSYIALGVDHPLS